MKQLYLFPLNISLVHLFPWLLPEPSSKSRAPKQEQVVEGFPSLHRNRHFVPNQWGVKSDFFFSSKTSTSFQFSHSVWHPLINLNSLESTVSHMRLQRQQSFSCTELAFPAPISTWFLPFYRQKSHPGNHRSASCDVAFLSVFLFPITNNIIKSCEI